LFAIEGSKGRSIGRTLDRLAPYVRGDRTHEEFVRSRVAFDVQSPAAGVPGFAGAFDPRKARTEYWLAARPDAGRLELSSALGSPWVTQRASWLVQ
jgi:glycerate kinase